MKTCNKKILTFSLSIKNLKNEKIEKIEVLYYFTNYIIGSRSTMDAIMGLLQIYKLISLLKLINRKKEISNNK